MRIVDSSLINEQSISKYIPRLAEELDEIRPIVSKIINEVKNHGDKALVKFTREFDHINLTESEIKVSENEIETAYKNVEPALIDAIRYAAANIKTFHSAQRRDEWTLDIEEGVKTGQVFRAIESIGIYVPGGRTIYPSTLLMAAIPAIVAGVEKIIICSPPQKDKNVSPEVLVTAKELGITDIYKVGGAQAISAMAFGTLTIPKVLKIVGPGNKWVTSAKIMLSNVVGIDNPAGPSEILIIADDTADYRFVIMDLLSQIEHDPDNIGIIVTQSSEMIQRIREEIGIFIEEAPNKDVIDAALVNNSIIIKTKSIEDSIRVSNLIAPEHLELMTKNPKDLLKYVKNAGAIFLGPYSPVPLGDYSAGTNHILPTGGTANRYSGLNIYDFLKTINILECNREGLIKLSRSACTLAEFEKLFSHKKSIEYRMEDKK